MRLPAALLALMPVLMAGIQTFALAASAAAAHTLTVSIAVFDPGVPEDESLHRDLEIFPRIREIEAMILPFLLRDTLADTGDWGAVRVVPEPDIGAGLLVSGAITHSDGATLAVRIRAVDASGRLWVDKAFSGEPGGQVLYDEIAAELLAFRAQQSGKALRDITEISLLRYAGRLAPSAFGDYLVEADDGTFAIHRLPAGDDPMMARIELVRETEYVITDAVDAKFQELHAEIASVYDLWREYRRKNVEYQADNAAWASRDGSNPERGSYEAIKKLYDSYKYDRIIAQEQDRLAVAFNNEVGPKVVAMEERVGELQIWVDRKYAEWHRILEGLFEAETGIEQ